MTTKLVAIRYYVVPQYISRPRHVSADLAVVAIELAVAGLTSESQSNWRQTIRIVDPRSASRMWSPRAERPHRSEVFIDDLVARVGSRLPIFLATGGPCSTTAISSDIVRG